MEFLEVREVADQVWEIAELLQDAIEVMRARRLRVGLEGGDTALTWMAEEYLKQAAHAVDVLIEKEGDTL